MVDGGRWKGRETIDSVRLIHSEKIMNVVYHTLRIVNRICVCGVAREWQAGETIKHTK